MKETLIISFYLKSLIYEPSIINSIIELGFKKTGNKFSIIFNGSTGYLNNIIIKCEGVQPENNNIIYLEKYLTHSGSLSIDHNKKVYIFYSNYTGVKVSFTKSDDQPF